MENKMDGIAWDIFGTEGLSKSQHFGQIVSARRHTPHLCKLFLEMKKPENAFE